MNFPIEAIVQNPIVLHGLVGIARAILGYAENCAEARKFLPFEFSKLFSSVLRVGAESFGLAMIGAPVGSAIVADMGLSAVKKAGTKIEDDE